MPTSWSSCVAERKEGQLLASGRSSWGLRLWHTPLFVWKWFAVKGACRRERERDDVKTRLGRKDSSFSREGKLGRCRRAAKDGVQVPIPDATMQVTPGKADSPVAVAPLSDRAKLHFRGAWAWGMLELWHLMPAASGYSTKLLMYLYVELARAPTNIDIQKFRCCSLPASLSSQVKHMSTKSFQTSHCLAV